MGESEVSHFSWKFFWHTLHLFLRWKWIKSLTLTKKKGQAHLSISYTLFLWQHGTEKNFTPIEDFFKTYRTRIPLNRSPLILTSRILLPLTGNGSPVVNVNIRLKKLLQNLTNFPWSHSRSCGLNHRLNRNSRSIPSRWAKFNQRFTGIRTFPCNLFWIIRKENLVFILALLEWWVGISNVYKNLMLQLLFVIGSYLLTIQEPPLVDLINIWQLAPPLGNDSYTLSRSTKSFLQQLSLVNKSSLMLTITTIFYPQLLLVNKCILSKIAVCFQANNS